MPDIDIEIVRCGENGTGNGMARWVNRGQTFTLPICTCSPGGEEQEPDEAIRGRVRAVIRGLSDA